MSRSERLKSRVRRLVGRQSALEDRVSMLEQQVRHLMATTDEDRRLQRRVAELVDVVEDRLVHGAVEGEAQAKDDRGA
jgi:vacuolar-type H+-ATPase subunit E/Vma4